MRAGKEIDLHIATKCAFLWDHYHYIINRSKTRQGSEHCLLSHGTMREAGQ